MLFRHLLPLLHVIVIKQFCTTLFFKSFHWIFHQKLEFTEKMGTKEGEDIISGLKVQINPRYFESRSHLYSTFHTKKRTDTQIPLPNVSKCYLILIFEHNNIYPLPLYVEQIFCTSLASRLFLASAPCSKCSLKHLYVLRSSLLQLPDSKNFPVQYKMFLLSKTFLNFLKSFICNIIMLYLVHFNVNK